MASYDVIVAGLGAMGSAALFRLAARGQRVLGIDRFAPPHDRGSSHGKTRIIREAYFEHPLYVPLVQRAYECWSEIESLSGRHIFLETGGLMLGGPGDAVPTGALASARAHALPHEALDARELSRRVPAWHLPPDTIGIWEPRAGLLVPEVAIEAQLALARAAGAQLRLTEPVRRWRATASGVEVTTDLGRYEARRLILSAGAWMSELIPQLVPSLTVERNALYWFRPASRPELFAPERFPVFIAEYSPGHVWYGFPDTGEGVKLALHHDGEATHPDRVRRDVSADETAFVRSLVRRFLPDADGELLATAVCLYTNTFDDHFIIDHHPEHPAVLVASPCSGHGFKFSSAIGEILADLATDSESRFDLEPFRISRLAAKA